MTVRKRWSTLLCGDSLLILQEPEPPGPCRESSCRPPEPNLSRGISCLAVCLGAQLSPMGCHLPAAPEACIRLCICPRSQVLLYYLQLLTSERKAKMPPISLDTVTHKLKKKNCCGTPVLDDSGSYLRGGIDRSWYLIRCVGDEVGRENETGTRKPRMTLGFWLVCSDGGSFPERGDGSGVLFCFQVRSTRGGPQDFSSRRPLGP